DVLGASVPCDLADDAVQVPRRGAHHRPQGLVHHRNHGAQVRDAYGEDGGTGGREGLYDGRVPGAEDGRAYELQDVVAANGDDGHRALAQQAHGEGDLALQHIGTCRSWHGHAPQVHRTASVGGHPRCGQSWEGLVGTLCPDTC